MSKAVELENLIFRYATHTNSKHASINASSNNNKDTNHAPLLNIPTWSVAAGQKHFILGPSGSGKSTLLNLLAGLLVPTSGKVTVLGEQISRLSARKRDKFRADHIGYIFQQFNLVPYLNAIDNIKLANHFASRPQQKNVEHAILSLLERLSIDSNDWRRPVNLLSVGQQQRIGIARALINQPKLIIADEPTSSLDTQARNSFIDLLIALCNEQQATLLFVSHDTQLATHFDQVASLQAINHPPSAARGQH
ncbi:ATP-binding cassette domain-containing protein [Thalassotalea euphylliae]|uniref:ATP-binding cassette domain-containing protein n=1 Tax=Thalassotalea euphylliae TaxID=1655234 RepID=A0A3E0TT70_9GAMM|nr:ATP-binding cassette domain-containing protein [Thalassotalea euphylliae]REL27738.1 ATP-binding cassette domain-containing protein [Thalassotalea euphylliae]